MNREMGSGEMHEVQEGAKLELNEGFREALQAKLDEYKQRQSKLPARELPTELDMRITILSALLTEGSVDKVTVESELSAQDEVTLGKFDKAWEIIEDYNTSGGAHLNRGGLPITPLKMNSKQKEE